jgi:phosphopantothenoylcysteine decarboxylase/phosphopantothenate--cysteine ligase
VVFAPAMHTEMWEHPATVANVATLRERGAYVIEPVIGRLTGADTGKGRLPEPAAIFEFCRSVLARGTAAPDLTGLRILVSAGGTREPLDPVRYLGNRSSGKQGYALAATAAARGADVVLVAANTSLPDPAGVRVVRVSTTAELREAVLGEAKRADVVVMAAAVADFRPADYAESKIKKTDDASAPVLSLVQNPHVLRELGHDRLRPGQTVVGFAAETGDEHAGWLEHGRTKLVRYGVDLLVVNEVGTDLTFGADHSTAVVIGADGAEEPVSDGPKERLADVIWDRVLKVRSPAH